MIKLVKIIFSLVLILYLFVFVSAESNSTQITAQNGRAVDDEARRRRKRFQFGHQLWWWGLKALSVLITVKIKIILLVLFIGGGIFYGLKVWQGSALGCPEPIISEIKHHDIHDILPYHGQLSPDISYSAPPPDAYSGYSGYSGYDSSVYSNTPASFSGGPPSSFSSGSQSSFSGGPPSGPQSLSSIISSGSGSSDGPTNSYLPPNRRNVYTGRAINDTPAAMLSDLMFRFLGVKSESCKRRFICELDFRNPFMSYALNYIGNDVFKHYRLDKESSKYPKKFADCEKLYSDCEIPKEGYSTKKRRRFYRKRNQTASEEETTVNPTIETTDLVTKYVKDQEK